MGGLRELDRVLRGEATDRPALARDGLAVPVGPLLRVSALLAAGYGVCMGVYGLAARAEPEVRQLLADAVKVPALFLLTLVVTFPSLYVFNALVGSRLGARELARLMAAAVAVTVAVLAGLGPIVAFFSLTTTSYAFVVLLNVAVFAVAGGFGLAFLLRTLEKLTARPAPTPAPAAETELVPAGEDEAPAAPPTPPPAPPATDVGVTAVFRVWVVLFAVVGAQMSWVLRPFIGSPTEPFTWFRPRESSFVEAVLRSFRALFAG
ncbi:MAG: hypothetical protein C0501_01920 [Isosphaera sp.]|nr:hypothetical protein [Isosphaera sp.]